MLLLLAVGQILLLLLTEQQFTVLLLAVGQYTVVTVNNAHTNVTQRQIATVYLLIYSTVETDILSKLDDITKRLFILTDA